MLGDQAAYRQDREAFEEVLQRSLTEISDLKAQGKGYQKRIAQLETELRAVQVRSYCRLQIAHCAHPCLHVCQAGSS